MTRITKFLQNDGDTRMVSSPGWCLVNSNFFFIEFLTLGQQIIHVKAILSLCEDHCCFLHNCFVFRTIKSSLDR